MSCPACTRPAIRARSTSGVSAAMNRARFDRLTAGPMTREQARRYLRLEQGWVDGLAATRARARGDRPDA
jgi:hypothetical protein